MASGIRVFKTSVSDNESGHLDMHYNRDGASIDEVSSIKSLFSRPTSDTRRLYLAGRMGSLRGQTGFVTQCSYRPHDQSSFDFRDAKHDSRTAMFSDEITPLWVMSLTTSKMVPIEQVASLPAGDTVAIVVESL